MPFTFCILSEYPFYNSYYNLCKQLQNLFKSQNNDIPIEIILFNIVNYGDTLEIDEYEDNNSYAVTKSADITEFGLGGCLDIANRFIMPASNCLLYFELYNEDNTLCNLDTLNNTLAYYGENGSAWEAPTFAGQDINMLGLNIIELTNENDGTRIPVDSINFDE